MTGTAKINALAAEIVTKLGKETESLGELMVVVESSLMGVLILLSDLYGSSPDAASAILEAAVQEATERFAQNRKSR